MQTLFETIMLFASEHSHGLAHEVVHSAARGAGWHASGRLINAMPLYLIIVVAVAIGIGYFVYWLKNHNAKK